MHLLNSSHEKKVVKSLPILILALALLILASTSTIFLMYN